MPSIRATTIRQEATDVREQILLDKQARKLVSAYYAYHSDYDEPCPCDVCVKARVYFAALLKEADRG